jgi:predicted transcriptional regulator
MSVRFGIDDASYGIDEARRMMHSGKLATLRRRRRRGIPFAQAASARSGNRRFAVRVRPSGS